MELALEMVLAIGAVLTIRALDLLSFPSGGRSGRSAAFGYILLGIVLESAGLPLLDYSHQLKTDPGELALMGPGSSTLG